MKPRLYNGTPPMCSAHSNGGSGCARYHVEGCTKCHEVRAKGIIKPNAADVPAKKRGRSITDGPFVDWKKLTAFRKAEQLRRLGPDLRWR